MRHLCSAGLLVAGMLVPLKAPPDAQAGQYVITSVASDGPPLGARGEGSINNTGTMVFRYAPDGTASDLFISSGGATGVLYAGGLLTDPFAGYATSAPPINNLGRTAFKASVFGAGSGIFSGDGGPTTTIALDIYTDAGSPIGSFDGHVDMNDAGTVAFTARLDATLEWVIYTGSGGALTTIADTGGAFTEIDPAPAINNAGTVAFWARTGSLPSNVDAIYTGTGGPLTVLYDSTGPLGGSFNALFNTPDINDSGTVVFRAFLDAGGSAILTGDGGPLTTIVDDDASGPFKGFENFAVNNNGQVVFEGLLRGVPVTADRGLFAGPDPVADRILVEGDPFMGGTVSDVHFFRGLNDQGRIVFRALVNVGGQFVDGIYLATPLPEAVPTVSESGLLAFAVLLLLCGVVTIVFGWPKHKGDILLFSEK